MALALLTPSGAPLWAAAASEKGAFNSAAEAFQGTFYDRAEAEFASFVQQFTNSARIPEALLFQAKARMHVRHASSERR